MSSENGGYAVAPGGHFPSTFGSDHKIIKGNSLFINDGTIHVGTGCWIRDDVFAAPWGDDETWVAHFRSECVLTGKIKSCSFPALKFPADRGLVLAKAAICVNQELYSEDSRSCTPDDQSDIDLTIKSSISGTTVASVRVSSTDNVIHLQQLVARTMNTSLVLRLKCGETFLEDDQRIGELVASGTCSDHSVDVIVCPLAWNWPVLLEDDVELIVPYAFGYEKGYPVRSLPKKVGGFCYGILAFPGGWQHGRGEHVSVYLEARPLDEWDPDWRFADVKYGITCMNWKDFTWSTTRWDTCTFHEGCLDQGWHDMVPMPQGVSDIGCIGPDNSLAFRARIVRIGSTLYDNNRGKDLPGHPQYAQK